MESSGKDIVSSNVHFRKFREKQSQVAAEQTYHVERNRKDQASPGPHYWGAENQAIWSQDP